MKAIGAIPAALSSILLAIALAGCSTMPQSRASGVSPNVVAAAMHAQAVAGDHKPAETGLDAFFRKVADSALRGVASLFDPAPNTYGPPEDAAAAGPKAWTRQTGWTGCTANTPHGGHSPWC